MQQSFGPPPQSHPVQWQPLPPPQPLPSASPGRGLAITAVVLAALALLGVLVMAGWMLVATTPSDDGSTSTGPLTGQLAASPAGGRATGDALQRAVTDRITKDGGDVSRMDCPETAKVAQGVVSVCHGVISSSDYAVVVYFEDVDGRFTLEPL